MNLSQILAVLCVAACAGFVFRAIECYQFHNRVLQEHAARAAAAVVPVPRITAADGGVWPSEDPTPEAAPLPAVAAEVPRATKYAGFHALLCGVLSAVFFVSGRRRPGARNAGQSV